MKTQKCNSPAIKRVLELIALTMTTANQVSKDIGITQQTLSRFLNGESRLSADNAILLANYFEVSLDYLLGREDDTGIIKVTNNTKPLTNLQKELLTAFDNLPTAKQYQALGFTQALADKDS